MLANYTLLDVFTDVRFAGNQLAVVDARDEKLAARLDDALMQTIAREFNLSETIFVFQPEDQSNDGLVRIFTCSEELPFAGHPLVGASVHLGLSGARAGLTLECGVGLVEVAFEQHGEHIGSAHFDLPRLPERVGDAPADQALAEMLGLSIEEIGFGQYRSARHSSGVEYLLIPVRDEQAVAKIKPSGDAWIYVFTQIEANDEFAARMFTLGDSIVEDAATGSAVAALAGLISAQGGLPDGVTNLAVRQGREMMRPSLIELEIEMNEGALVRARLGGSAVTVASGTLLV